MTQAQHEIVSPAGELSAVFVPGANMLCRALRHRGVDLLPPGRGVARYADEGKTMGIPLLYPWANRLSGRAYSAAGADVTLPAPEGRYTLDPNGLPRHGALPRLLGWRLAETGAARPVGDRVVAVLSWDTPELLELFPYPHELSYEAVVSDEALTVTVTVRAGEEGPVPVAFGLHPYLHLPDVPRRDWRIDLGARRRLITDELLIPTGESEPLSEQDLILGTHSFDDGLADLTEPPEFSVADGDRRLRVVFDAGFPFAQVYAPPDQDIICFEPMTAPTNALVSGRDLPVVAAGDEFRATFRVVVADNDIPPV
jgi:aldose 1-epimerase